MRHEYIPLIKKISAVSALLFCCALFTGCRHKDDGYGSGADSESSAAEAAGQAAEGEASEAEGETAAASGGQVLKVVQPYDPGTFEPGNNDEQSYNRIMVQIYDTLTRFDENGELQPWLAESWEMVDETHWQFNLRQGVKFSDGSDFTANDVFFTLQHAKEGNLPNAHYNMINIDECSVVDDYTIIIGLDYPCVTLPNHMANGQCVIGSKAAYEEFGGDYLNGAAVGTGAYKLVEYTQGDMIKLTANEYYWNAEEGKPFVKDIEMRVIPSTDAASTEAKTGTYDIVIGTNGKEYDNIDNLPRVHMEKGSTAKTTYLIFNLNADVVNDINVRRAIAAAIDVDATVKLAYGKIGRPAEAFITPGILGSNAETYKKYFGEGGDAEAAKALLTEAGYPDGVELEITVASQDTQHCDMAEAIQVQLEDAGISLSINRMEYVPLHAYLAAGSHQMCIYGFTSNTMEADGFLNQLQPGADANSRVGYDNQEFFDLYQEGCSTEDREARGQIWEQCLEMLMKDYVAVPLNHQQMFVAVNDRIEGFWIPQDYEELFYEDFSIKAPPQ